MNALESLADWQGMDVQAMARRLLGMTVEQRTALRQEYAAQASGPLYAD
jgi:hypothetical protein